MQLSAPMNEGTPGPGPASPSSPVSDPGSSKSTPTARDKPVKVLPCPRCESLNTKFCYYNNYSVTQPRHFCRQCQRYWTAGGTLRNVPVGGGSRKKNRHPHSRPGEPYSQRSPGAGSGASGSNHQFALPNGGFQQQHDMVAALNLPGFALQGHQYGAPFGLEQLSQLSPGVYASILNKPQQQQEPESNPSLHAMFANPQSINQGGYFTAATTLPFHSDHTVKPEFWPVTTNMAAPQGNYPPSSNRFESSSSMLLNLGLNNGRPPWDQSRGQLRDQSQGQLRDQSRDHESVDVKPAASTTGKNGSSPLHGSSIEEEGSNPSNGFSKSGYEEGDAVSSMWHSLHDMDNLHLSVKW